MGVTARGIILVCLYTYSGVAYSRGREGGRRNVNNDKIKDEMTKRQTLWLTNVN